MSQISSELNPLRVEQVRLAVEAIRLAEAMGLMVPADHRRDAAGLAPLARALRRAGIATAAAALLDEGPAPSGIEMEQVLTTVIAALEASPVPEHEWKALARVFPADDLATLLDVSLSSLKRYASGERETPDLIAARLHFLALVVGNLAGTYNDTGIRRWFQRKRTQLDGRPPAALLRRNWDPDDDGPQRVRSLARSLVTLSGA